MKRVLCLFDYMATTGFATVSQNIVPELLKNLDVKLDIIAINYFGSVITKQGAKENITVYPAIHKFRPDAPDDEFGRVTFLDALVNQGPYDAIFIILDLAVITPIIPILYEIREKFKLGNVKQFKSILYFPVDGRYADSKPNKAYDNYSAQEKAKMQKELPKEIYDAQVTIEQFKGLDFFDIAVTYTEYGRAEVLRHLPGLKGKLKVVPHGVNPKDFYPKDVSAFKQEYFGDRFVVTNINRNQHRKDIPNTILGFIEAKKLFKEAGLPDPLLYLHMHPEDPMGWNIPYIISQTGLSENDYKLLDYSLANHGASIEMLNDIYNASDVYLTTVTGGGWELCVVEAFSTLTPVICPAHTSLYEISAKGKRAILLEELTPCISITDNTIRQQTNIYEVGEKIFEAYQERFSPKMAKMLEEAEKFSKNLSWQNVCKTWVKFFKEIL